jgi:hypothetical protein
LLSYINFKNHISWYIIAVCVLICMWSKYSIFRCTWSWKCLEKDFRLFIKRNLSPYVWHFFMNEILFMFVKIRTHTAGSPCNLLYIYIYKKIQHTEKNTVTKINHGQQKYLDFMMETNSLFLCVLIITSVCWSRMFHDITHTPPLHFPSLHHRRWKFIPLK